VGEQVGVADRLGTGISGVEPGQIVAAMPISGAYAEFLCRPQRELVPVPSGLDAAEAVSLLLNYVTAYQMRHRLLSGYNPAIACSFTARPLLLDGNLPMKLVVREVWAFAQQEGFSS
jgi:NADPH:quinone reductase-like Zn-dependent oxidoreductase